MLVDMTSGIKCGLTRITLWDTDTWPFRQVSEILGGHIALVAHRCDTWPSTCICHVGLYVLAIHVADLGSDTWLNMRYCCNTKACLIFANVESRRMKVCHVVSSYTWCKTFHHVGIWHGFNVHVAHSKVDTWIPWTWGLVIWHNICPRI